MIENMSTKFRIIDTMLDALRNLENKKMVIYELLAAVIHLNTIEFEDQEYSNAAQIKESSMKHIVYAAELLKVSTDDLKNVLLNRSLEVSGSAIM